MKMKVYSIGRDAGCDIVINDNSDATSRRHATLTVMPSGKMTISDQSRNGTYVNGIKISPNVAVPVTRKDNISFAHVYRLDWNLIPQPVSIMQYVIYGLIALAIVVGGIIAYSLLSGSKADTGGEDSPKAQTEQTDSCETCKKPITECEFKGKHSEPAQQKADTCQTCKKPITDCAYKGKHPAPVKKKQQGKKAETTKKCSTCGKPITECQYKGKHPDPKKESTRGDH